MHQRCTDPKHKGWRFYGAKGIAVCPEWHDFDSFLRWAMASGYKPGLTIDRIKSERGYEPGNCGWITRSENGRRAMEKRWGRAT